LHEFVGSASVVVRQFWLWLRHETKVTTGPACGQTDDKENQVDVMRVTVAVRNEHNGMTALPVVSGLVVEPCMDLHVAELLGTLRKQTTNPITPELGSVDYE
jgi:hypothetical protein